MKKIAYLIFAICLSNQINAQEIIYNKIYDSKIKTVLMYFGNDDLSMPVWNLGSSQKLTLSFDNLSLDVKDYYYTITHCNADWTRSDLYQSDYIDGYFEDQVSQYQSSFNTNINYTHYKLKFPTEYLKPTISGNYIIQVYEDSQQDNILFTKRFMVIDPKTTVNAKVRNMNQAAAYQSDQELEIIVDYLDDEFYDISQNLKVQVLKNRNWINSMELTRPDLIKDNEFTFNDFTRLKFQGVNEFHFFNTKNIHHFSENIVNISFVDNMYHFQLAQDKDRTYEDYIYKPDLNGQFRVDVNPSEYPETEADYVYAYFSLKMNAPMQEGEIFVWGGLSNYEFTEDNKMNYNFEQKAYECRLFLKQGYYNYQYVLLENDKLDFTYIEGNHARTENTYSILVYYHDFSGNYDRLLGFSEINSRAE
jgi:hypothetical protein